MAGTIAIVGRPNVGKSALFNRIVGKRIAIVHDRPGVTRDRVTANAEYGGASFTVIDTGGIGLVEGEKSSDIIMKATVEQVDLAIEASDVVLFVVSTQEGVMPLDYDVASRLRQSGKRVMLLANKVDDPKHENLADEFVSLGFEEVFAVSALHDNGIDLVLDATVAALPEVEETDLEVEDEGDRESREKPVLKLAVVGRPNVGKSSIINALTQSDRVIVSEISGTTRDAVDVPFEVEMNGVRQRYLLIDTAGIRKRGRVGDSVEFFSVNRSEGAIHRCDLAILVIDAIDGVTEQDKKIAGKILDEGKACIVVINKWDLVSEELEKAKKEIYAEQDKKKSRDGTEPPMTRLSEFAEWVQSKLFFIDYAPVVFTSAHSGFHLERLLETVRFVYDQMGRKVPTGILNRTLNDAVVKRQPVSSLGTRLKFFYATQISLTPPKFLLFINKKELFSAAYEKYLAGELRKAFGFEGCPIRLIPKPRPKTIEPVRRGKKRVSRVRKRP